VFAIENFGTLGYLSAMKHCKMMLGNTSSGFVEASYFPIPVVNLGIRQDGRLRNRHIFDVEIKKASIVQKVREISQGAHLLNENAYGDGDTAVTICKIVKEIH
jgi:GDP/UDP-N,N'-diacetylbacillosamine 2-epimerase (hydrolysing)